MKKVKARAAVALLFAALLLAGVGFFGLRELKNGGDWVTFTPNAHAYTDGILTVGRVLDRNGAVLTSAAEGTRSYAEDAEVRRALLHAVGDLGGNISTGALSVFAKELIGYNIFSGAYTYGRTGRDVTLTLDAELCAAASEELDGRAGTVAVYNYKTGEILCMVSGPTFDPADPPELSEDDEAYEGVYLNRFLSSTFTPGSVFKLVTTMAALEHIDDLSERTFECTGSTELGGDTITCLSEHGTLTFEDALAVSCNCTFGQLAVELGGEAIEEAAEKAGLTEALKVSGIVTGDGSVEAVGASESDLAWAGIGQYNDLINPCALLRFMGAIANGGRAAQPRLLKSVALSWGLPTRVTLRHTSRRLIEADTAARLRELMANNVTETYGADNYPGLALCAKSGTAEVGVDKKPHAWFVGFLDDIDHPLAFVVLVEHGGSGSGVGGAVANSVLQKALELGC